MGWWHINHVVQLNSNSCDKIRGITFLFSKPFTNVGSSPSTSPPKTISVAFGTYYLFSYDTTINLNSVSFLGRMNLLFVMNAMLSQIILDDLESSY